MEEVLGWESVRSEGEWRHGGVDLERPCRSWQGKSKQVFTVFANYIADYKKTGA